MSQAKRFFIGFGIVYAIGAIVGVVFLGPPGLSRDYLDEHQADHERYLEITKSSDYKLHQQNPEAHPAEGELAEQIAFVEAYEDREAYRREDRRRWLYGVYFDWYNVLALTVIAVRFGRKPLVDFLDSKIEETRTAIEEAAAARKASEEAKAAAKQQIDGLEGERAAIVSQGEGMASSEREEIEAETGSILEQIDRETEERQALEEIRAKMRLKRELVLEAVRLAEERLRAEASPDRQRTAIEQLARELGDGS